MMIDKLPSWTGDRRISEPSNSIIKAILRNYHTFWHSFTSPKTGSRLMTPGRISNEPSNKQYYQILSGYIPNKYPLHKVYIYMFSYLRVPHSFQGFHQHFPLWHVVVGQDGELDRRLNVVELTLLGIGACIGAGIFVLTGAEARIAGPSVSWGAKVGKVYQSPPGWRC